MSIEVRRAGDRFLTEAEGRSTRHSFSFGAHYDPANLGFATMVAHNDEDLPAGTGYPDHRHADLEIVTWVLEGALRHTDGEGNRAVLLPGDLQRIRAGSGIIHSEVSEPGVHTRFLQTWLRPDEPGGVPAYGQEHWDGGPGFTEVASPAGPLAVQSRGARLHLAHSGAGTLHLPDAPVLHLFVADGCIELGDRVFNAGDAARLVDEGGRGLKAPTAAMVSVWSFGN